MTTQLEGHKEQDTDRSAARAFPRGICSGLVLPRPQHPALLLAHEKADIKEQQVGSWPRTAREQEAGGSCPQVGPIICSTLHRHPRSRAGAPLWDPYPSTKLESPGNGQAHCPIWGWGLLPGAAIQLPSVTESLQEVRRLPQQARVRAQPPTALWERQGTGGLLL